MFKAKIIHDRSYYRDRRIILILGALFGIVYVFLMLIEAYFLWLNWLIFILITVSLFLELKYQRRLLKKKGQFFLYLDLNRIEIINGEKKVIKQFHPERVEKILLNVQFRLLGERISEAVSELKGKTFLQRLEIVENGKTYSYFFEMDSHYMIVQLRKVIDHWNTQKVSLELIEN